MNHWSYNAVLALFGLPAAIVRAITRKRPIPFRIDLTEEYPDGLACDAVPCIPARAIPAEALFEKRGKRYIPFTGRAGVAVFRKIGRRYLEVA